MFKRLVYFLVFIFFLSRGFCQVLIVETVPPFSDTDFVQNNGDCYLLAEIENIDSAASSFNRVSWNGAQYQDFYYIGPNGWVECQINVPVSGNYNIYTRLCQHGNSSPRAKVYVDGNYKNEISGKGWAKTSTYLSYGTRTIKFTESGTGDTTWPLRLVGFDAVAVTNHLSWQPPEFLSTHPYTGNDYWWRRPSEQISQVDVSVNGKVANFIGKWEYKNILVVDDAGSVQASCEDFSQQGDSLAGQDLSSVVVSSNTNHRTTSGLVGGADKNRISPNYDMIDDNVTFDVPAGQAGYLEIKKYNSTLLVELPGGNYTWDGTESIQPYADYAAAMSYLLRFVPTSGSSTPLYSCVNTDPEVTSKVWPRVTEFSPNNDDVYDQATVYLRTSDGFDYQSGDSVVVKNNAGSTVKTLSKTNPIIWDGKDSQSDLCSAGQYSIEILDSALNLRAGSRFTLIDNPPIDQSPHDVGDFFMLGMWTALSEGYSTSSMDDYLNTHCNTFRVSGPGTVPSGSTRVASSFWSAAESRNLKVFVNLASVVYEIADMPIAPCEAQLEMILDDFVDPIKNKTSLIGYELLDEPAYDQERAYRLRAIQQVLHKLDPAHPSAPVLIGYDSRISGHTADMKPGILLIDVYPCRDTDGTIDIHDQPGNFNNIWGYAGLSMLEYMDWAMNFVEPRGVSTWVIHQGHKFSDNLDEPTPEEIRLQVWLSLSRAAKGFFFFIYETQQSWIGIKDNPSIKSALSDIYSRLQSPSVFSVLPHLEKDTFNVSITGGGNPYGYSSGEAAALKAGTKKYIIAANRNCTSSDIITINSSTYPNATLKDLETSTIYAMSDPISFGPGDGKIFELIIQPLTPPAPVDDLNISYISETKIDLDWSEPAGTVPVSGYRIYDSGDNLIDTVTDTRYSFNSLEPGASYCYYVNAYNDAGLSDPSNTVCDQTFWVQPPTVPDDVRVLSVTSASVEVTWAASTDNVAVKEYEVFLDDVYHGTTSQTSYTFNCDPSTRYTFAVSSVDVDGGTSARSSPICAYTCRDSLPAELIGHWRFDNNSGATAYDSSLYANDGTISGAQWINGYYNSALEFDGTDDNVNLGPIDITTNKITIAAWVKADSYDFWGKDNRIVSKAMGTAENDHYWMLSTIDNSGGVHLRFRVKTNGTTTTLKGLSEEIPLGQWCHVAGVYDGSQMKIYVNAVADTAVINKTGNIDASPSTDVLIGANPSDYKPWDGVIDEVRVYSQALSGTQVADIMNDTNPLPGASGNCYCSIPADFNCDCNVDMADFYYIAYNWGFDTYPGLGDIVENNMVDLADLKEFLIYWLDFDTP